MDEPAGADLETMSTLKMHPHHETRIAKARFAVAVTHLIALAGLLHLAPQTSGFMFFEGWQVAFSITLVACSVAAAWLSPASGLRRLRGVLLPCLSLPPWDAEKTHIWLPGFGWRTIDDDFRTSVEKQFTIPLVCIALLVLPLFAAEHFLQDRLAESPWLAWLLSVGSALVWAAFAYEFIVCCTIAEKRFTYIKQHWLDAIIILLPLVAFLRAARLARLAKIQQTARVFRMRGMVMRMWKAVVLFDLLERVLFRDPEKHLAHLEKKRATLLDELARLDGKIAQVESQHRLSA